MNAKQIPIVAISSVVILLIVVAFTGYVKSYLDDEVQTTYFIKRFPTFQVQFYDPFANEGDDTRVDRLSPTQRKMFSDYCKYRFGITSYDANSLEKCKKEIPDYL